MGFFRLPFVIHHRVAAKAVKDYVLSLETTDIEKSIAQLFHIELRQYVFERNCLLLGLAHQGLAYWASKMPGTEVDAAHGFFLRIMMEYNEGLRAMNAMDAYAAMNGAQHRYYVQDTPPAPTIAATFIGRLTENTLSSKDFDTLPQFLNVVDSYVTLTFDFVKITLSKLK